MKLLFALPAVALLGLGATACGGAGSASQASSNAAASGSTASTASSTTPTQSHLPRDSDDDNDNSSNSRYDNDDNPVVYYGHTASAAEVQAITGLVKGYYAAAAASDGAKACSLIYSILAESVIEEYGQSTVLHGKTCSVVMSRLLKRVHWQLVADVARLKVTLVRVNGNHGLVLLRFGTIPERRVLVQRERGVWKMGVLLDIGVP